jgi:hypothetical protein
MTATSGQCPEHQFIDEYAHELIHSNYYEYKEGLK